MVGLDNFVCGVCREKRSDKSKIAEVAGAARKAEIHGGGCAFVQTGLGRLCHGTTKNQETHNNRQWSQYS